MAILVRCIVRIFVAMFMPFFWRTIVVISPLVVVGVAVVGVPATSKVLAPVEGLAAVHLRRRRSSHRRCVQFVVG